MSFTQVKISEDAGNHIMFVHSKCGVQYQDFYLRDVIYALLQMHRIITVYTTNVDQNSPLNKIEDSADKLAFVLPCRKLSWVNHIPFFKSFWDWIQITCLVIRVIYRPPNPRPNLIIADTNPFAVWLLKTFTLYPVIYIKHFPQIYNGNHFASDPGHLNALTVRFLRRVDEILVQTECLKDIINKSSSTPFNKVTALNLCYDTGLWMHVPLDLKTIVKKLPENYILFVVFAEYKPRSNLKLVLKTLDYFIYYCNEELVKRIQLVIGGNSEPLNNDELIYYENLVEATRKSRFKSRVTFFQQSNIIRQVSLIDKCTAILNPTNFNVYPGAILAGMNLMKPIVSVNNGFAAKVLKHDVSGFLLEDDITMFASKMHLLITCPEVGERIATCAKAEFDDNYSYPIFQNTINSMITRQINRHH